ncbi:anti-sigma factor domain-containing protein [Bacillus sp. CGMCC 1.16607]|uniref:anti-sigma factor domain-containing protein n=1 Tax=Bacillus sp. CGMCC 1.16607 TaxID=3351842 RepID=UPI00363ACEA9
MRKGIVMEVDERFLTLLTPEGEFLRARKQKQDYLIGQEIDFFPIQEVVKKTSWYHTLSRKSVAAAVFAIMIASAAFLPIYGDHDVYAYMSIDVNPSIELAINDELEVIHLDAYNHEGEQIISKLSKWKNQDVSVVTNEIIKEIKDQGFFQDHQEVVISTVYKEKKKENVTKKLEANIEEIEETIEKDNLHLTVIQGTKEERKAAHKIGVTTGKLKEEQSKTKKEENNKIEKKPLNKDNNKEKNQPKTSKNENQGQKPNGKPQGQTKVKPNNQKKEEKDIEKKQEKGNSSAPGQIKKEESNDKNIKSQGKSKGKEQEKKSVKVKSEDKNDQEDKDDDHDDKNKKDKSNHQKKEKGNKKEKKHSKERDDD